MDLHFANSHRGELPPKATHRTNIVRGFESPERGKGIPILGQILRVCVIQHPSYRRYTSRRSEGFGRDIGLRLRLSVTVRPFALVFAFVIFVFVLVFILFGLRLVPFLPIAGPLTPSTLLGKGVTFGRNMVLLATDSAEFNKLLRPSALGSVDSLRLGGKSLESCPRFWPRELPSQVSLNRFRGIGCGCVVTV